MKKSIIIAASILAAFLIGGGMGNAAASPPTKTVAVKVTPASCIKSLDLATRAFLLAADQFGDVANGDVTALYASGRQLTAMTGPWQTQSAACRASR